MGTKTQSDTHTYERPAFRERVMALAGSSTWREPVEGRGTDTRRIPTVHLVAAALAFGRRGPTDIGPDMACDLATDRIGHAVRITRELRIAMGRDRSRIVRRAAPWLQVIADSGYRVAMGLQCLPCPEDLDPDDYALLVAAAERILLRAADEAVSNAERAQGWRREVA
ncbi:hypothetical protein [Lysobacter sp. HA35]